MATIAQLKARKATLDKIILEAKAEARRADDVLAAWEEREQRHTARQRQRLGDPSRRFPSLGGRS